MKIWLDDERPAPDETFTVCKDIFQFNNLLASLEGTQTTIDFISFDYYIDPKNHRFTGLTAIRELTFFDQCVWPVLSGSFSFATHSSDSSMCERMEQALNEYISKRR